MKRLKRLSPWVESHQVQGFLPIYGEKLGKLAALARADVDPCACERKVAVLDFLEWCSVSASMKDVGMSWLYLIIASACNQNILVWQGNYKGIQTRPEFWSLYYRPLRPDSKQTSFKSNIVCTFYRIKLRIVVVTAENEDLWAVA